MLRREAPAKINLCLEVTGTRPDGYHNLRSVMQTISIADTLEIRPANRDRLAVSVPALETPENLVWRALEEIRHARPDNGGVEIALDKRIPVAAGLGGGSSDGASTLIALNDLWKTELSRSILCNLAERLGSDVPFFLTGGTALIEGRGEIVEPLPSPPAVWYLLVKPPAGVSTARVFAELRRDEWSDGHAAGNIAARIRAGNQPGFGPNDLEPPLFRVSHEARACYDLVASLRPEALIVSGSGPTVVGLFHTEARARDAADRVPTELWARVAMPYDRREE
ncbi:MAG TPA: 4-(cytidine 5'-diphospho)-2-C-methyl-D-erythritol kinase [Chloroflexota bacterium]|nr:4-(cytidine 5'-diphospho)-2-C-methyl-D-erythritol kinase [Chloroflexota bacterium]